MVITSLVNLYETLAAKQKVDKSGWCKVRVSYGLDIDINGKLKGVISIKIPDKKGKKEIAAPVSVPMQLKRSSNVSPNFLCDTSSYFLGRDNKDKPKRSRQCFEESQKLHSDILKNCNCDEAKAILNFYKNWDIDNTENYLKEIGCNDSIITDILKSGANLMFFPLGKYAVDISEICKLWDDFYNSAESDEGICMVTGKKLPIAKIHPAIKGIRGAQSMGTTLVAFNAEAFESYGKHQGYNSPISEYAAFAYSTALNYLLSESDYVSSFGDTTVVCWTEDVNEACQDIMAKIYGSNDNKISQDKLWSAVNKLSEGQHINWNNIPIDPDNKFYILGLSPNAGRVSVRFFLQNTFGKFMKNIVKHEKEMEIVTPKFIENSHFPVWKLLLETVNSKSKNKIVKPQLAGDLVYSILTGYKYPETLFNGIMNRISAERDVSSERSTIRSSVIKAYLLRNYPQYKEVLTVELNENCTNQAYVLGELFSVLEEIQSAANPQINTTINDRYFTSASSTPALVFPLLIDLSQNHLKKLKISNPGYSVNLQKKLTELMSKITEELPSRMNMQEKGIFQLGYYHQKQRRFTKKEEK